MLFAARVNELVEEVVAGLNTAGYTLLGSPDAFKFTLPLNAILVVHCNGACSQCRQQQERDLMMTMKGQKFAGAVIVGAVTVSLDSRATGESVLRKLPVTVTWINSWSGLRWSLQFQRAGGIRGGGTEHRGHPGRQAGRIQIHTPAESILVIHCNGACRSVASNKSETG